jgi:hypothetical protein
MIEDELNPGRVDTERREELEDSKSETITLAASCAELTVKVLDEVCVCVWGA